MEDTKVNPTVKRELMSLSEKLCTEREEGRQEGREEVFKEAINNLMQNFGIAREEALRMLTPGGGCSVESFLESRSTSRRTANNLGAFMKMMNIFSSKTDPP